MRPVRNVLLGSAAGLTAVAGAHAADLPAKTTAPVEFVRVCSAFGNGFFYIPGTDTCLRVSGRARGEYQYTSTRAYVGAMANGDVSGFSALGRLALDARTKTDLGTVRTFIRIDLAYNTGGKITSGSNQRFSYAFSGTAQDSLNVAQTFVGIDKAFVQFAGFTAGRASSFFDFYAHDLEFLGATGSSDVPYTNLFAYTATLGNGFSATLSVEDPLPRRQPAFSSSTFSRAPLFASPVPIAFDPITGLPTAFTTVDVSQRERVPDVVGALRYDGTWGSAQLSAAMHEVSLGKYQPGVFTAVPGVGGAAIPGFAPFTFPGTGAVRAGTEIPDIVVPVREPDARYGFAVQGGVKVNLPMLAKGDVFWLQAAYTEGALSYVGGGARFPGLENNTVPVSGRFQTNTDDAVVFANGVVKLTEAESVTAALLHYWTPEWRQAFFGSYTEVHFPEGSRGPLGPLVTAQGPIAIPGGALSISPATAIAGRAAADTARAFSPTLRDYSYIAAGSNLIYSPVKDLDIGLEVLYVRIDMLRGRVADQNKFGTVGAGGSTRATAGGGTVSANIAGLPPGTPLKTVSFDDAFVTRFRVQRDF